MSKPYDLLVIGGGSAGFNAARVAASLGKRVAIVDGAKKIAGLCILNGCMPSKTLLYSTEVLHLAQHGKTFGLRIPSAKADMKALHTRKLKIIGEFADYRMQALESGKYDIYRSRARFIDTLTVELADGRKLSAKKFLIGTGSKVSVPPTIPGLAATPFWISDDVLDLDFIPESVIVLGGGIVACELAQFLRRIGSKVTLIQRSPNILKDHSPAASEVVQQAFRDEGIDLHTDTKIDKMASDKKGVSVRFYSNGKRITRRARFLFNALGREPNIEGLDLAAAGVKTTTAGRIVVNKWQQTSVPHIYAGGDVCGPHDIVHLAVAQGELAARHAFGIKGIKPIDQSLLLNVVFTDPPLATIGLQESELAARNEKFLVASYPFDDHGKSILMEAKRGYVKVIAEPKSGRILGAEIVGPQAGELIHILSGPLTMKATVFDMLRAPWYHPTLAEILTYPLEEIADLIKSAE
ncbi:MAG: NAD(P)/FAD-dependent oxidoreductase [Opitutaceae bacterium]|jgi:pyruvate/2-oxoglutarate dehydrogenase complex dihydrolipoamide dehydrogenase (E3) component